jgi:N-acyl-D-amino-acid deacylase
MSKVLPRLAVLGICLLGAPLLAAAATGAAAAPPPAAAPFDVIIVNGRIVDGTGSPWYSGDVGIRDGRIAALGKLSHARAKRRIDAAGNVVAPGFIDMLGQSELTILVDPRLPSKIYQGITTEITGEGNSVAPMTGHAREEAAQTLEHYGIKADWQTLGEYFARLERQGIGINLASYVGATSLREVVIGVENRPPTPAELDRMRALVREAMEEGAMGVSTALEYAPAPYARPTAAFTPHTCAPRGTAWWPRWRRPSASRARRTFPRRSGT